MTDEMKLNHSLHSFFFWKIIFFLLFHLGNNIKFNLKISTQMIFPTIPEKILVRDVFLLLKTLSISIIPIFSRATSQTVKKNNSITFRNSSKWATKISRKKLLLSTHTLKKYVISFKQSARTLTAIKLLELLNEIHLILDSVAKHKIPIWKHIFILITLCHFKLRILTISTITAVFLLESKLILKVSKRNEKVLWVLNHISRIIISSAIKMSITHRFIIWTQTVNHLDWILSISRRRQLEIQRLVISKRKLRRRKKNVNQN